LGPVLPKKGNYSNALGTWEKCVKSTDQKRRLVHRDDLVTAWIVVLVIRLPDPSDQN